MSPKNRQKPILVQSLSADVEWSSIGCDLAKFDLSVVGITDSNQLFGIDRISNDAFLEMSAKLKPTVFSMEPCNGSRAIAERLRQQGHVVNFISGSAVSAYIQSHKSFQKNDLNDAQALAFLNRDSDLVPIREKTHHEARLLTLYSVRKHYVEARSSAVASFKGQMQCWGVPIKKSLCSIKKMTAFVTTHEAVFEAEGVAALLSMVEHIKALNEKIVALNKLINSELEKDERHHLVKSMPFIGPTTECRFLATVGDVARFERPRQLQAFYGLVPKNKDTAHNGRVGRMLKHGDKAMRLQLIQCAGCVYMAYIKGRLPDCGIKKWIDKKVKSEQKYALLICALAGKLARILWALLVHGERFDIKRAGLSREAIKAILISPVVKSWPNAI